MANITIIGAGSLVFSSRLTADILTFPALRTAHFRLVDIEPKRLSYAETIVQRMFIEGKYREARVSSHTDRVEALQGADYVIISILVGGYPAIEKEIDIPMKYGIDQCIGDTLTPGGIMRCLRTLPVLLEIFEDIKRHCPGAHVLNFTNPMGMLMKGTMDAYPEISQIGLCHSVPFTLEEWAQRIGIPAGEIDYICAGINHEAWFLKFAHNGKDLLPEIRKLALKPEIWYGDSARMEYVKHFNYPVTESSGHVSEYSAWFRKNSETTERYCRNEYSVWNGGHGFIKELYARPDWEEQMQKMADWEEPIDLNRSHDYGSRIINALETGEAALINGNVKNKGYITNLQQDLVVEVPCYVDRNGFHPVTIGDLPPHLAAINRTQLNVQELAVRATVEKDPEQVFHAMAMDPLTAMSASLDEIRAMTRELMKAHAPFLGEMAGKLPEEKPLIYREKPTGSVEKHMDPATTEA